MFNSFQSCSFVDRAEVSVVNLQSKGMLKKLSTFEILSTYGGPVYSDRILLEQRLTTFENSYSQAQHLAIAGFFQTKEKSKIFACYYCSIEISDFQIHDNAFLAHAEFNSNCLYYQLHKHKLSNTIIASESVPKSGYECKICLLKEKSVLFLPCLHFMSCANCVCNLFKCPLCKSEIHGVIKIYNI